MKAEHRKELQTNALRAGMRHFVEAVKERPRVPGRYLLLGVLVVVVIGGFIVWNYIRSNKQTQNSKMWLAADLLDQNNAQFIQTTNPDSRQWHVVLDQIAWQELWHDGIMQLGSYNSSLKLDEKTRTPYTAVVEAQQRYAQLAEVFKDNPVLAAEALYNRAVAEECLAVVPDHHKPKLDDKTLTADDLNPLKKTLDKAAQYYKQTMEAYPDTVHGKMARERYEQLQKNRAQIEDTYRSLLQPLSEKRWTWFARQFQRQRGAGNLGGQ